MTASSATPTPMRKFIRTDGSSEVVRTRQLWTMDNKPGRWIAQVSTYNPKGEWTGTGDAGGPYETEAEAAADVLAYQPCVYVYRDRRETAREVQP